MELDITQILEGTFEEKVDALRIALNRVDALNTREQHPRQSDIMYYLDVAIQIVDTLEGAPSELRFD